MSLLTSAQRRGVIFFRSSTTSWATMCGPAIQSAPVSSGGGAIRSSPSSSAGSTFAAGGVESAGAANDATGDDRGYGIGSKVLGDAGNRKVPSMVVTLVVTRKARYCLTIG